MYYSYLELYSKHKYLNVDRIYTLSLFLFHLIYSSLFTQCLAHESIRLIDLKTTDPFSQLGVDYTTNISSAGRAYRLQTLRLHPDKHSTAHSSSSQSPDDTQFLLLSHVYKQVITALRQQTQTQLDLVSSAHRSQDARTQLLDLVVPSSYLRPVLLLSHSDALSQCVTAQCVHTHVHLRHLSRSWCHTHAQRTLLCVHVPSHLLAELSPHNTLLSVAAVSVMLAGRLSLLPPDSPRPDRVSDDLYSHVRHRLLQSAHTRQHFRLITSQQVATHVHSQVTDKRVSALFVIDDRSHLLRHLVVAFRYRTFIRFAEIDAADIRADIDGFSSLRIAASSCLVQHQCVYVYSEAHASFSAVHFGDLDNHRLALVTAAARSLATLRMLCSRACHILVPPLRVWSASGALTDTVRALREHVLDTALDAVVSRRYGYIDSAECLGDQIVRKAGDLSTAWHFLVIRRLPNTSFVYTWQLVNTTPTAVDWTSLLCERCDDAAFHAWNRTFAVIDRDILRAQCDGVSDDHSSFSPTHGGHWYLPDNILVTLSSACLALLLLCCCYLFSTLLSSQRAPAAYSSGADTTRLYSSHSTSTAGGDTETADTPAARAMHQCTVYEMRADTYNALVHFQKPGCRTILLICDASSRDKLVPEFRTILAPYRRAKSLTFAYLLTEKGLRWYTRLLRPHVPRWRADDASGEAGFRINPKNCIGTVLSINVYRKYFCMYHAKHPERRRSVECDDEEGSAPQLDKDSDVLFDTDLLVELGGWLERLFDGQTTRYPVNYWPDFIVK